MERKRAIYDNLDIYLRDYIWLHVANQDVKDFKIQRFACTFKVGNIFKQIVSFGSYYRYTRNMMQLVTQMIFPFDQNRALLMLI